MKKIHPFVLYQLPAFLWMVAIFISSSIPSVDLPSVDLPSFDKVIHFGIFFGLAVFVSRALLHQNVYPSLAAKHLIFTVIITGAYGALDEFHQYFVPGRNPSILDLAADVGGALLYVGLVRMQSWRRKGIH